MPFADGVYGRSTGQAYARSKAMSAKKAEGTEEQPKDNEGSDGPQQGSIVHVKHHGGGKFSVKHEDGSVTKHDSPEDLQQHMSEHFGLSNEPDGDQDDEYGSGEDYEGGDALKSILG